MKGQEFDSRGSPFEGFFGPPGERNNKPRGCPFSKQHHHDQKPGYVPFGKNGFEFNPEHFGHHHHHHGPHHRRCGPPEDGHRRHGCGRWGPPKRDCDGPSDHHCHGPPGFRPGHDGRPQDFHGHGPRPWWFGRRGNADSEERPWFGPWGGPRT